MCCSSGNESDRRPLGSFVTPSVHAASPSPVRSLSCYSPPPLPSCSGSLALMLVITAASLMPSTFASPLLPQSAPSLLPPLLFPRAASSPASFLCASKLSFEIQSFLSICSIHYLVYPCFKTQPLRACACMRSVHASHERAAEAERSRIHCPDQGYRSVEARKLK